MPYYAHDPYGPPGFSAARYSALLYLGGLSGRSCPRPLPHRSPRYSPLPPVPLVVPRIALPPRRIDTADIDVSSPRRPALLSSSLVGGGPPAAPPLRRGRAVVRLHTRVLKERPPVPRTPGERLAEKFYVAEPQGEAKGGRGVEERGERKDEGGVVGGKGLVLAEVHVEVSEVRLAVRGGRRRRAMVQVTVDDGSEDAAPLEEVPVEEVPLGSGGCGRMETAVWVAAESGSGAEAGNTMGSESAGEASTAREETGSAADVERRDHSDEECHSVTVAPMRNGIPIAEGEESTPQMRGGGRGSEGCLATLQPQLPSAEISGTKPKANIPKQYPQGSKTNESTECIEALSSSGVKVAMILDEPSLGEEQQATFQKSVHLETCNSNDGGSSTTPEGIQIGNLGVTDMPKDIEGIRKESNLIQKANNKIIFPTKEEKIDNCMSSLQKTMVGNQLSEKTNRILPTNKGPEKKLEDVNKSPPSMLHKNTHELSSDKEECVLANKKLKKPKYLSLESIAPMSSLDEKMPGKPSTQDSPKQILGKSSSSTSTPNSAFKTKVIDSSCEVSTPGETQKEKVKPLRLALQGTMAETAMEAKVPGKLSPPDSPKQILGQSPSSTPKPNSARKLKDVVSSCEVSMGKPSPPGSPKQILGMSASTIPTPNSALKTKVIDSSCEVSTPSETQKEKVNPLRLALQGTMAETAMEVQVSGKPSPPDSPKQILGKSASTIPTPNSALKTKVIDSSCEVSTPGETQKKKVKPLRLALQGTMAETAIEVKVSGKPSPPGSPKQILGKSASTIPTPNSALKTKVIDSSCEVSTPGETQKEMVKPLRLALQGTMAETAMKVKVSGKPSPPDSPKQILGKSASTIPTPNSALKTKVIDSSCQVSTPGETQKEKPKPPSFAPESIMTESLLVRKMPEKSSTPHSPKQILEKSTATSFNFISTSKDRAADSSCAESTPDISRKEKPKPLSLVPQSIMAESPLVRKMPGKPSTPDSPQQIPEIRSSTPNSACKNKASESSCASTAEESQGKQEKHLKLAPQIPATDWLLAGKVSEQPSTPDSPKQIPGKNVSTTPTPNSAAKDRVADSSCAASVSEESRKKQGKNLTLAHLSTAAEESLVGIVPGKLSTPDSPKRIPEKSTSKTFITHSTSKDKLLDFSSAASTSEDSRKEQQEPTTLATQSTVAGKLLERKMLEMSCVPDSLKHILGKNALTKSTFLEISESSIEKSVNESELKKWDNVQSVYSYSDPLRRNSFKAMSNREYKHFEISLATTSPEGDGQTNRPEPGKIMTPRDKPNAGVRKETGEVGMKTKSKVSVDKKLRFVPSELTSERKPKSVLIGSPGEAEEIKAESSPDGGRSCTGGDTVGVPLRGAAMEGVQADGSPRSASSGSSAQPSDSSSSESEEDDSDDPEALSVQEAISRASIPGTSAAPATSLPRFRDYNVQDFLFLKVLGKGSFGKVFLAALRGTDRHYAVKCLKKRSVIDEEDVECTLIERKVLSLATAHPYLCHLFCTFQTESHLFFVMEYLNGGDLMFHIQRTGRFEQDRSRFYAAEIVSGLKFLHKKGIVYRDLKLDNLLLDYHGHVRLADFGMCKLQIFLDRTADTFCGTPDYIAPEIIKGYRYNQTVDWWSFGVLLYEMLVGQSPFQGCDDEELFWCICNQTPSYPRFLTHEARDILSKLLQRDSDRRLGAPLSVHGDVCHQPFFRQIDWWRLERRELEPPFKPALAHPLDLQYFDAAFTREPAKLTPTKEHQSICAEDQLQFAGFSYTNPNATD